MSCAKGKEEEIAVYMDAAFQRGCDEIATLNVNGFCAKCSTQLVLRPVITALVQSIDADFDEMIKMVIQMIAIAYDLDPSVVVVADKEGMN